MPTNNLEPQSPKRENPIKKTREQLEEMYATRTLARVLNEPEATSPVPAAEPPLSAALIKSLADIATTSLTATKDMQVKFAELGQNNLLARQAQELSEIKTALNQPGSDPLEAFGKFAGLLKAMKEELGLTHNVSASDMPHMVKLEEVRLSNTMELSKFQATQAAEQRRWETDREERQHRYEDEKADRQRRYEIEDRKWQIQFGWDKEQQQAAAVAKAKSDERMGDMLETGLGALDKAMEKFLAGGNSAGGASAEAAAQPQSYTCTNEGCGMMFKLPPDLQAGEAIECPKCAAQYKWS